MTRKTLAERDRDLALSVVSPVKQRKGRKRLCIQCGLMYPQDELNVEFDDDHRAIGYVCDGCY